jgi:hypothetical protein
VPDQVHTCDRKNEPLQQQKNIPAESSINFAMTQFQKLLK